MNDNFFNDTMQGLLEAVAISRGNIDMVAVPDMPAHTLRAESVANTTNSEKEKLLQTV
ncbi:MAG: hypothetical protein IJ608_03900 [Lachnospiraceae bacterium]|nr:hypothetical protein [Lachnospiraceae bacterium]